MQVSGPRKPQKARYLGGSGVWRSRERWQNLVPDTGFCASSRQNVASGTRNPKVLFGLRARFAISLPYSHPKSQHRDRTQNLNTGTGPRTHARTDTQRQTHHRHRTADTQTADTHTSESQPRPKHTHRPRPPTATHPSSLVTYFSRLSLRHPEQSISS